MLILIAVAALLCSSSIHAGQSINVFYPAGLTESACTGKNSWTKWFNSAKPSNNGNLDKEDHSVIQAANRAHVCARPQAMQAQSVSDLSAVTSISYSWSMMNNLVSGFISNTPGVDFQVRFCCANTDFVTTTTTTTTARPMPSSTCGRAQIKHSLAMSRIFGGSIATPNSWPFLVLYEQKKPCGNNQICSGLCGGTLLDANHVLTATHCLDTSVPIQITITAGLHDKTKAESDTRQVRSVQQIFMYPGYNTQTHANDITILRLDRPVQFNKYVQPACLPGPEPKPNASVAIIGWGKTNGNANPSNILKQAKVKVIGDCSTKYWGQVNDEKQVCVGDLASRDSACQGDSGGSMLYEVNGQWVVSGLTSFGSPDSCSAGSKFMPNVYTRVSYYLDWIRSILQKN